VGSVTPERYQLTLSKTDDSATRPAGTTLQFTNIV
jgi:hypothetical protein